MEIRNRVLPLVLAVGVAFATTGPAAQPVERLQVEQDVRDRLTRGERVRVLVELRVSTDTAFPDVTRDARAEALSRVTARLLSRLPRAAAIKRLSALPFVAMDVDQATMTALLASPDVVSVRADELRKPSLQDSVPLIGAPTAWAAGATGSGWAVAVIDSGVDKAHSFLAGKVVSEACYSTTSGSATSVCPGGVDSTNTGSGVPCSATVTGCDHGTHVAGIAAGKGTTFSGVAKEASLIAIQVYSRIDDPTFCAPNPSPCAGAFDSDVLAGLNRVYALRSTFNIGSALLALGSGSYSTACDASVPQYKTAIDLLRGVNIPTVASSGNEGLSNAMAAPACVSTAISVGASDKNDLLAPYTNRTSGLSLLAPGSSINSPAPGGGFTLFQGTSMAAAHVAGAWAIMRQSSPSASVSTVLTAFTSTAVPINDPAIGITRPRIDVGEAFGGLPLGFDRMLTELPDFDGQNTSDILWKRVSTPGDYAIWLMNGSATMGTTVFGAATDWQMFDFGDLNGDTNSDIIWQSTSSGSLVVWFMDGTSVLGFGSFAPPAGWLIRAVNDVNGDGRDDLIWESPSTNRAAIWFMNGAAMQGSAVLNVAAEWTLAGSNDLNADGRSDLIWRSELTGAINIWFMDGGTVLNTATLGVGAGWNLVATADGNGDGKGDFYWRNPSTGALAIWFMNGGVIQSTAVFGIGTGWDVMGVGDLDADNKADIFWRSPSTGSLAYWFMNGATVLSTHAFSVGPSWLPLVPE